MLINLLNEEFISGTIKVTQTFSEILSFVVI